MARNIIDLPTLGDDGRLYRDTALDLVESLIPNPWKSCHAPDLLELENGDLLCCWFAGSREGNADISIAVARVASGGDSLRRLLPRDNDIQLPYNTSER